MNRNWRVCQHQLAVRSGSELSAQHPPTITIGWSNPYK